jgi:hypothetical protein
MLLTVPETLLSKGDRGTPVEVVGEFAPPTPGEAGNPVMPVT